MPIYPGFRCCEITRPELGPRGRKDKDDKKEECPSAAVARFHPGLTLNHHQLGCFFPHSQHAPRAPICELAQSQKAQEICGICIFL